MAEVGPGGRDWSIRLGEVNQGSRKLTQLRAASPWAWSRVSREQILLLLATLLHRFNETHPLDDLAA